MNEETLLKKIGLEDSYDDLVENLLEEIDRRTVGLLVNELDYDFNWRDQIVDNDGVVYDANALIADNDDLYQACEGIVSHQLYKRYRMALENTIEYALGRFGLSGEFVDGEWVIELQPGRNWREVVTLLMGTQNGVGLTAWFNTPEDFMEACDYSTYSEMALNSLGWIKHYPAVYGTKDFQTMLTDEIEDYIRNW